MSGKQNLILILLQKKLFYFIFNIMFKRGKFTLILEVLWNKNMFGINNIIDIQIILKHKIFKTIEVIYLTAKNSVLQTSS